MALDLSDLKIFLTHHNLFKIQLHVRTIHTPLLCGIGHGIINSDISSVDDFHFLAVLYKNSNGFLNRNNPLRNLTLLIG